MTKQPLYQAIFEALAAVANCKRAEANASQKEWLTVWRHRLNTCSECLPYGDGFDLEPLIETKLSRRGAFRIVGAFHPTDHTGCYRPWKSFIITVQPASDSGFKLTCSLRGHLRDRVMETYELALWSELDPATAAG
jgi:hypothetical protein